MTLKDTMTDQWSLSVRGQPEHWHGVQRILAQEARILRVSGQSSNILRQDAIPFLVIQQQRVDAATEWCAGMLPVRGIYKDVQKKINRCVHQPILPRWMAMVIPQDKRHPPLSKTVRLCSKQRNLAAVFQQAAQAGRLKCEGE